jgi:type II secretory pathway pseudopilin PulG
MDSKGVLLVTGVVAAGVVLVLLAKQSSSTALAQQQLAYANQQQQLQYQQAQLRSPSGQIGSILSSVGGFLNSGALSGLFSSFGVSGSGSNDPGLGLTPVDSTNYYSNDPGLEDYYD